MMAKEQFSIKLSQIVYFVIFSHCKSTLLQYCYLDVAGRVGKPFLGLMLLTRTPDKTYKFALSLCVHLNGSLL